jgi:peptide chain release factor 2
MYFYSSTRSVSGSRKPVGALAGCGAIFDPSKLTADLDALEERMRSSDFWDDQVEASKVSAEYSRIKRRLEEFAVLEGRFDDLESTEELLRDDTSGEAVDNELLEELVNGVARLEADLQHGEEQRFFSARYDEGGAILNIHPGAGGTESQDWASMLLRMYLRWFERRGFKVAINDMQDGDEAGLKSVTLTVEGDNVYGLLASEKGVHRLVRMSPFDSANRRHTSFVSVDASPLVSEDVEVQIDDDDLRIDTYRSSGAGGQHVNKTSSAIRITHLPTNIVVQCQNEKSQHRNRESAMKVLKARLYDLELKKIQAEKQENYDSKNAIGFGSQIRTYTMQPYRLVKDHRTGVDAGDVDAVMDGELDKFIRGFLLSAGNETR